MTVPRNDDVTLLRIAVPEAHRAEDLVHYLDERELEAAKDPEAEIVLLRLTEEPDQSPLAVVVALEEWMQARDADAMVVRLDGTSHRLQPHRHATEETPGR